jgi:excisionase family DNA binding protein
MEELKTPTELAAKYPFLSRSAIYEAIHAEQLPFYRVPTRRGAKGKYLVREADFLAWLESYRHEARGAATATTPRQPPRRLKHLKLS